MLPLGLTLVNTLNDAEAESSGDDRPKRPVYQGDTTLSLPSEPSVRLAPGVTVLEKFKIIELLGEGGMGSVYRVEHLLMNRQFALKCLNKYQAVDAGWKRFQNEAKAAHMLDHANLLKVYEFGLLPGGQPFFLMELVEGVTLADEIKHLGHLPVERAIKIFIQVAFAIGYAHESRVIHRDLKPSNIMLVGKRAESDAEVVKVVDFGIAKLTGVDEFNQQTLTKTGEIFGSPLYMSPEQCTGVAVDHRSDLYSLGCVFYEALTSAPPFMGESALSTMMKHQSETQASLKEASLGMQFPPGLEHVVARLLEKDPQRRYQSADQLARDLIHVERSFNDDEDQAQTSSRAEAAVKRSRRDGAQQTAQVESKSFGMATVLGIAACTGVVGIASGYFLPHASKQTDAAVMPLAAKLDPKNEAEVSSSKQWSQIAVDKRVFQFPAATSLGQLIAADGQTHAATGKVSVPKDLQLGLVPSDSLVKNPQLLDKFKPGELVVFDFDTNKNVTPAFFEKIGTMTQLKGLNLFDTEFSNRDVHILSKLTNLLYLDLGFTEISAKEALKYAPLKSLQCVDLSGVDDGKAIIEKMPEMPELRQLMLVNCELKDEDMIPLVKTDHLKILDLAWSKLTDKGVETLSKLKNLEYLDISKSYVSPEVWKSLVKMPNLRKIKMADHTCHPWSNQMKKYFDAQMAKHAPQVGINWVYEANLDFAVAHTDLTWVGTGMGAHTCPLLKLMSDENLMGGPIESTHH